MKQELFHDGWTCRHLEEEGPGMPVRLPDDAMLREERTEDALGGLNVSWFEGHDYLYAKHFALTAEEAQQHHVLEFEGVYRKAEVRINGQKAAYRPYGYTNFYVDCDELFREGDNLIEVIARNVDQPNSRWYTGAGIYRPVRLWSSGPEYVELNGVRISTLSTDPARIRVDIKTSGAGPVKGEILDAAGAAVFASCKQYIDEAFSDYEKTSEKNRENVKRRWEKFQSGDTTGTSGIK